MYNASKEIPLDEKKVSKKERGHLIMKKLVTLVIAIALVLSLGTLAAAAGSCAAAWCAAAVVYRIAILI